MGTYATMAAAVLLTSVTLYCDVWRPASAASEIRGTGPNSPPVFTASPPEPVYESVDDADDDVEEDYAENEDGAGGDREREDQLDQDDPGNFRHIYHNRFLLLLCVE